MPYKVLKEAEETFRQALEHHADHYALDHLQDAERLLLQARRLVDAGEERGKEIAEAAKRKAQESQALAAAKREELKRKFGSELGSCFHQLSEAKVIVERISRKVNRTTYLSIMQRIELAQTVLAHVRKSLEAEDFRRTSLILGDAHSRLQDIDETLSPILEQLWYQHPEKKTSWRRREK